MNAVDALEIGREAVWTMLKVGGPILLLALVVGLAIALFQALTQMQEMTLSFVPKIVVIFLSLLVFLPFMLTTLVEFTEGVMDRIVALGASVAPVSAPSSSAPSPNPSDCVRSSPSPPLSASSP